MRVQGSSFGIAEGDSIESLEFDASGLANIPRALARLGEEPSGRLLTLCRVYSRDGDAATDHGAQQG